MRLSGRRRPDDFDHEAFATIVEGADRLTAAGLDEDEARAVDAWVHGSARYTV